MIFRTECDFPSNFNLYQVKDLIEWFGSLLQFFFKLAYSKIKLLIWVYLNIDLKWCHPKSYIDKKKKRNKKIGKFNTYLDGRSIFCMDFPLTLLCLQLLTSLLMHCLLQSSKPLALKQSWFNILVKSKPNFCFPPPLHRPPSFRLSFTF